MIEEQLAHRFRAAVADEPPMGFDPDDVVDRAARTERRRSATLAASTAAATVVVATVTVLQLVRADDGGQAVGSEPVPTTKPADPCPPTTKTPPSKTPPSTTEPSKTGPTRTEPTKPDPKPTEPTKTRPTETKPAPPPSCDVEARKLEPFTGWEAAVERVAGVTPTVLAERVPGVAFNLIGWKPYEERRCVTGVYQLAERENAALGLTVCHEQKSGVDLSAVAGGDWGTPVSDTTNPDGSRLRVYRNGKGLAVQHLRGDGVVVQVDTGTGPEISQAQLTAIATDGRLTF